jgi:hypothetical protein
MTTFAAYAFLALVAALMVAVILVGGLGWKS